MGVDACIAAKLIDPNTHMTRLHLPTGCQQKSADDKHPADHRCAAQGVSGQGHSRRTAHVKKLLLDKASTDRSLDLGKAWRNQAYTHPTF